jgi:MoaA/NifB/PqqE/SkfB family radical SAM enzyme
MNSCKPWRITLDTNPDDCNLSCVMCEEHSIYSKSQDERRKQKQPPRRMPIELLRKLIVDAKNLGVQEVIPSTMGEPLLYKDFEEIIALIKENNLQMNLTTNGTFPKIGAEEWAKKIVPITSDVKISWNASTEKTDREIMVKSNWNQRIQSIKDFIKIRDQHFQETGYYCRVTFQMTFLKSNIHELSDIIKLAIRLGVDRLKGHHLWAHFQEIQSLSMRNSKESILEWNHAVEEANQLVESLRLANGKKLLLENIFLLNPDQPEEIASEGDCPFLTQEIWISAEGRFNPCCAPDKDRLTLGDFGNLNDVSLKNIWNGTSYQNLVSNYKEHSLCQSCNMRKPKKEELV